MDNNYTARNRVFSALAMWIGGMVVLGSGLQLIGLLDTPSGIVVSRVILIVSTFLLLIIGYKNPQLGVSTFNRATGGGPEEELNKGGPDKNLLGALGYILLLLVILAIIVFVFSYLGAFTL